MPGRNQELAYSMCFILKKKPKPNNPTNPKPEWLFKNTDLEKETDFLGGPGKWQSNSLLGCLSSDLKKLPVGFIPLLVQFVASLMIGMDFMMQPSFRLAGRLWPPTPFTQATDELLQNNTF